MGNRCRRLIRNMIVWLLLMFLVISNHSVFANMNVETLADKIANYIVENENEMAGITTILINDGSVFKVMEGFADIENGIPVDENTVFEWGSISKVLVWI